MLCLIAMLSMLIDHIGYKLDIDILRIIGRLAMPIYAYFIVQGYHKTHNVKKYVFKVLAVALASQILFYRFTGKNVLNICFLWVLGLLWLHISYKNKGFSKFCLQFIIIIAALYIPVEYGLIGLLWVILWDKYFYDESIKIICICVIGLLVLPLLAGDLIQIFAMAAVPVVVWCRLNDTERFNNRVLNKLVWSFFYPMQFVILNEVFILLKK